MENLTLDELKSKFVRPKKTLSLAERIAVIEQYEQTPNARLLARMFGCGRTQIQTILRNRTSYLKDWQENPHQTSKRPNISSTTLNIIVHEWYRRCRLNGIVVTDPMIRTAAKSIANILNYTKFSPRSRWLDRFKSRYNINEKDMGHINAQLQRPITKHQSFEFYDIIKDIYGDVLFTPDELPPQEFLTLNDYDMVSMEPKPCTSTEATQNDKTSTIECIDLSSEGYDSETSQSPIDGTSQKGEINSKNIDADDNYNEINDCKEALNHLGPLERFALDQNNVRAIGLINRLEEIFKEELIKFCSKENLM